MLEEGEGCARGRVRLPSLSLTIYRGKGGGGGALGFPRGGAAATGETLDALVGKGAFTPVCKGLLSRFSNRD